MLQLNEKNKIGFKDNTSILMNLKCLAFLKNCCLKKKGNFLGGIFGLDDDEIAMNLYYDEDVELT